jgi:hypothetical protein
MRELIVVNFMKKYLANSETVVDPESFSNGQYHKLIRALGDHVERYLNAS